jgi:hypothetical protein
MSLNDMYTVINSKEEMAKSIFLYVRVIREMAEEIAEARYGERNYGDARNRIIDEYFKKAREE